MKIEAKDIQTLTLDEQVESGDSNEDDMFSIVGDYQEKNTSIYVDSVFETRQVDEKIAFGYEEQVVMLSPTELRFPSSDEDSCSEILENAEILINNEKDGGQVEAISVEGIEVAAEVEDNMDRDMITTENEEAVFVNATIEGGSEVKVKGNPHVQALDEEKQIDFGDDDMITGNFKEDLSNNDKTCLENLILREDRQQMQYNRKQGDYPQRQLTNKQVKMPVVVQTNKEEVSLDELHQKDTSTRIKQDEYKGIDHKLWTCSILVFIIWCVCLWYKLVS